jgi:hypothetical protein
MLTQIYGCALERKFYFFYALMVNYSRICGKSFCSEVFTWNVAKQDEDVSKDGKNHNA